MPQSVVLTVKHMVINVWLLVLKSVLLMKENASFPAFVLRSMHLYVELTDKLIAINVRLPVQMLLSIIKESADVSVQWNMLQFVALTDKPMAINALLHV